MPLEEILKRIEEEASARKKEIEAKTAAEAEKIASRADEQIDRLRKKKQAETEAGIESMRKQRLALKRLDLRNELLRLKHEIIDGVYEEAFKKIRSLPEEKYMELIEKLFLDRAEAGRGRVCISEKDRGRISAEFISQAAEKLRASGRECDYELADDCPDIEGGFILETEKTRIDCSLGALFRETKNRLGRETGEFLFKNG